MKFKNAFAVFAFLIFFAAFVAGCSKEAKEEAVIEEPKEEESAGTGILAVESSPSIAQVYIDGELKGETPFILYNVPAGGHKVLIKKEGHADFEKHVSITAGRKEELNAQLAQIKAAEIKPEAEIKETINKIALGDKFIMYFDFENALFTEQRKQKTDIFSKNYKTHVYFTSILPAKIGVVDKPIAEVKKEDCIPLKGVVTNLYSEQTLCVNTVEGSVAATGGKWETEAKELEWIVFN